MGRLKADIRFSETNPVLQLFKANVLVFILSSVATGAKLYFGNPINCLHDNAEQKSYVDGYCYHNLEPLLRGPSSRSADLPVYSNIQNYKWIPLTLLLQGILAYFPTWLWNSWRDVRVLETVAGMKDAHRPANRRKLLILTLANDLYSESIYKGYAKPFFFCEMLHVALLGLNLVFTNLLFSGRFLVFGLREMRARLSGGRFSSSPVSGGAGVGNELLPQLGSCYPHGKKEKPTNCLIPFNSICESVMLLIWISFVLLIFASLIGLVHRAVLIMSRSRRRTLLLESLDSSLDKLKVGKICEKLGFYSWFVLYRISRNIDPLTFQDIIAALLSRFDTMELYKPCKQASSSSKLKSSNNKSVVVAVQGEMEQAGDKNESFSTISTIV